MEGATLVAGFAASAAEGTFVHDDLDQGLKDGNAGGDDNCGAFDAGKWVSLALVAVEEEGGMTNQVHITRLAVLSLSEGQFRVPIAK